MYLNQGKISNASITELSGRVHAFTFRPEEATGPHCTQVRCATTSMDENAACAFFGCEYTWF